MKVKNAYKITKDICHEVTRINVRLISLIFHA